MGQSNSALSHNQIAVNQTSVSYLWREPNAANGFATGVSLHSHTSQSKETLDFIAELSHRLEPFLQPIMRWFEEAAPSPTPASVPTTLAATGHHASHPARLAFDLERAQIENSLQLPALVSITDHDSIQAPLLLRSLPTARHIPVSVEWTVPFGTSAFHLGVHNLPSKSGADWMARLEDFTTRNTVLPIAERNLVELRDILAELDELPNVLVIFNHPMWDLYRIGEDPHSVLVNDFLVRYGQFIHALELNGLRNWKENREVGELAASWNQLIISGGDRHGLWSPTPTSTSPTPPASPASSTRSAASAAATSCSCLSTSSPGSIASSSPPSTPSATIPASPKATGAGTSAPSTPTPTASSVRSPRSGAATTASPAPTAPRAWSPPSSPWSVSSESRR